MDLPKEHRSSPHIGEDGDPSNHLSSFQEEGEGRCPCAPRASVSPHPPLRQLRMLPHLMSLSIGQRAPESILCRASRLMVRRESLTGTRQARPQPWPPRCGERRAEHENRSSESLPNDFEPSGPAKTRCHFRAELAGSGLEDPAFPPRGCATVRGSQWLGGGSTPAPKIEEISRNISTVGLILLAVSCRQVFFFDNYHPVADDREHESPADRIHRRPLQCGA
jgi:hypothetical protein